MTDYATGVHQNVALTCKVGAWQPLRRLAAALACGALFRGHRPRELATPGPPGWRVSTALSDERAPVPHHGDPALAGQHPHGLGGGGAGRAVLSGDLRGTRELLAGQPLPPVQATPHPVPHRYATHFPP